jgi:hypothetical protein
MTEKSKQVEELQARISLLEDLLRQNSESKGKLKLFQARINVLEDLLRQVVVLWERCRLEGNFSVREAGSASHELVKLVYKIEKTVR